MKEGIFRPVLVVLPLLLSIVGFVLAMLALFAGTGPRQQALEEYHLIAINMSNFGHDLVPSQTSSAPQPTATDDGGFGLDDIQDSLNDIGNEISDQLGDIADDFADKIAEELGISQWYSVHVMTVCQGDFAPNATTPDAWYNTTTCTAQAPGVHFNLTDMLYREIELGPLDINPADIPIPEKIQQTVDFVNNFLLTTFVFYVLASGFTGLSVLSCIVALTLKRRSMGTGTAIVNVFLAAMAVLTLAIGSAIATGVSKKGVAEINDAGDEVGISAIEGTKLMTISWVAFAVMFATLLFWSLACCFPCWRRRGAATVATYAEKGLRTGTRSGRTGRSAASSQGLLGIFRWRR
ncbi:hypothetical protein F4779DRAFT_589021 [Xylariaceae sp. FL0662B]|nr:hypothetical protein F4779DRAFT_589021 [Xylariaceae sp. FL0662B]